MQPLVYLEVFQKPMRQGPELLLENTPGHIDEIVGSLDEVIENEKKALGWCGDPAFMEPGQAKSLRDRIRGNKRWLGLFRKLLSEFGFNYDPRLIEGVHLPWSNSVTIATDGRITDTGIAAAYSHSYISQLQRNFKISEVDSRYKATSICNILVTRDGINDANTNGGMIVLGMRGGRNWAGTIGTLPTGQLTHHRDSFFGTLYSLLNSRVGLSPNDCNTPYLIGLVEGGVLEYAPHFVFVTRVKLPFYRVNEAWSSAPRLDVQLVHILNGPNTVLRELKENTYDIRGLDPSVQAPPGRHILPQTGASLLVYLAARDRSILDQLPDGYAVKPNP